MRAVHAAACRSRVRSAVTVNSAAVAGRPDGRRNRGGISLLSLVVALIAGHAMSSMALLVLPAVAPAVASDYGIDASLIGYQISLVSVGMLALLAMLGNLSRKLGDGRLEIEIAPTAMQLKKRRKGVVAVPHAELPPLTAEQVRETLERVRR